MQIPILGHFKVIVLPISMLWDRTRIPNTDPDPGQPMNADPDGSGTGIKFLIKGFLITKFLIDMFLIPKFLK
jgi:hypothetical protein